MEKITLTNEFDPEPEEQWRGGPAWQRPRRADWEERAAERRAEIGAAEREAGID